MPCRCTHECIEQLHKEVCCVNLPISSLSRRSTMTRKLFRRRASLKPTAPSVLMPHDCKSNAAQGRHTYSVLSPWHAAQGRHTYMYRVLSPWHEHCTRKTYMYMYICKVYSAHGMLHYQRTSDPLVIH